MKHIEAPVERTVCQLTGTVTDRPSTFFQALDRADLRAADTELVQAALTAAVGFYDCPCGSVFEFDPDSTLEDYAALNRWLGHHGRCTTSLAAEASGDRPEAVKRPDNHHGAPTSGHFFRTPPGAVDDPAAVIPPTAAGSPTSRK